MRSWKCRITAASLPGIEIAKASPAAILNIGPGQRELSLKRLFGHEHDAQRGALPRRPHATPALMAQSPRHAWAIMDTPMTATMEVADPYYRDGDRIVRARVMELLRTGSFTSPYRLRRGRIASRSTGPCPLEGETLGDFQWLRHRDI